MQVGPGGATSASTKPDHLFPLHLLALLHGEVGEMQIEREQSLSVINDHAVPFEIKIASQKHGSGIESRNRGPTGHTIIEALVIALYLSVEDALGSKYVGNRRVHRRAKIARPFAPRGYPVENGFF